MDDMKYRIMPEKAMRAVIISATGKEKTTSAWDLAGPVSSAITVLQIRRI